MEAKAELSRWAMSDRTCIWNMNSVENVTKALLTNTDGDKATLMLRLTD